MSSTGQSTTSPGAGRGGTESGGAGGAGPGAGRPPREPLPRGFWVLWSTVVIDLIGFGIAIPVLGPFARKLGASAFEVGLVGAAFSLAQFVVAPLIGRLSDRFGRKPVLVASLTGTAIASLFTAQATAVWMLFASRAFDGASGATLGVAQAAVADISPPHRRPQLLGLLGAAFGIGFTVGPGLSALASLVGGERAPFYLAAALAAVNAIATAVRFPETKVRSAVSDQAPPEAAPSGLATTWREAGLPLLIGVSVLATLAFSMFEQMFTLFGEDRIGFNQRTSAVAFVIVGLIVSLVQGGLIRPANARFNALTILRSGYVSIVIGLVILAGTRSWAVLVPALLFLSLGQGFATPTSMALVQNRIAPSRRGEILGVQQRWVAAARIAGPLLAGLLYGSVAEPAPFLFGAAVFGLCLVLLARVAPSSAPAGSPSHSS